MQPHIFTGFLATASAIALFTTTSLADGPSNPTLVTDNTMQLAYLDNDKNYEAYKPNPYEKALRNVALDELKDALASLDAHGLNGTGYVQKLNQLASNDNESMVRFMEDVVADLRFGATRKDRDWYEQQPVVQQAMNRLMDCSDLSGCMQKMAARHPQYEALQMLLTQYQQIAASGGWPHIDSGRTIRLGDSDQRVPVIREYLTMTGDYRETLSHDPRAQGPVMPNTTYDSELFEAMKRFQERHGIKVDGVIGSGTRKVMNVPIESRIEQLELSLERLRRLPEPQSKHYVHVNVPSFTLTAYEGNARKLEMPVIVGKKSRKTPMFDNVITTVGLNPTWTPTQSILRKDILPKLRHDPSYARRGGYTVRDRYTGQHLDPHMVDWHSVSARDVQLVQRSGRSNALGKVKFLLPNNQSVYLHDTSKPYLFKKSMRALSSGCIRLSDPQAFLDYVINAQEDERFGKLREYYAQTKNRHISLDQPIPVTVTYFTAWVGDDGQVTFYNDIYKKDRKLRLALEKETRTLAMR